jgi:hypothetical protein
LIAHSPTTKLRSYGDYQVSIQATRGNQGARTLRPRW